MTKDECPSKQEVLKSIFDAVYAQYPKKEWQGLSNDEIGRLAIFDGLHHVEIPLLAKFILAIEQALKEKNT